MHFTGIVSVLIKHKKCLARMEASLLMLCITTGKQSNQINKSRLLFSSAEMFKKPLWQSVWTQIRLLLGAVCSGSTNFASKLNSSVMLGNYLQHTTSADDIFRCIFFLGALRVKKKGPDTTPKLY